MLHRNCVDLVINLVKCKFKKKNLTIVLGNKRFSKRNAI